MLMDRNMLQAKFEQAISYNGFVKLGESEGHRPPWDQRYSQLALTDEQDRLVKSFSRTIHVLCMSGTWCGDCVVQGPMFARIAEANANARREGVADRVTFVLGDALATDVSEASVVTLYLLSSSNMKLRPILTSQLSAGARIVSHAFNMGDWQPDAVESFNDSRGNPRTIYLWKFDGEHRP